MNRHDRLPLKLLAKILKHNIPDQRRDQSDREIRSGKNVAEGKRHALPVAIGAGKLAHQ